MVCGIDIETLWELKMLQPGYEFLARKIWVFFEHQQPETWPTLEQELMERGIYGLGGFLQVSKELRVLWSAPYLSRLWSLGREDKRMTFINKDII